MRIMVIADEESSWLWDHFEKEKLAGVDLIISCGDLHPHYLSFLTTFTSASVLYVHGNHDDKYEQVPPEGCTCIEDQIFYMKESGSSDLAVRCVTAPGQTSIRSGR